MSVKISAAQVNELRKKTGAGMMDCKKALVEAEADFDKAIEILRKKGQKIAAKRSDREAGEGVIIGTSSADGKTGYAISFNCETDFVAKNDDFVALAKNLLDIAAKNDATSVDALKALPFEGSMTIADKITEQTGVIGEKIDLTKVVAVKAETVVVYNHPGNRLTSVVALNKAGDAIVEAGKEVAMQVAAMNPLALNEEGIDQATIDKEVEIGKEQAVKEGKPADLAEKIAKGRLNKFFKENTLLAQEFLSDNKKSVAQYLESVEKDLTVTEFVRVSLD